MKKTLLSLTAVSSIFFLILLACGSETSSGGKELIKTRQAVEYLVFEVDPEQVEQFIALDHEIWTRHLQNDPGFISKQVWHNASRPGEVTLLIFWNSVEEWKSIPEEQLKERFRKFNSAFGAENYRLIDEYHQDNQWYKVMEYR